jgi:hypothetical protein
MQFHLLTTWFYSTTLLNTRLNLLQLTTNTALYVSEKKQNHASSQKETNDFHFPCFQATLSSFRVTILLEHVGAAKPFKWTAQTCSCAEVDRNWIHVKWVSNLLWYCTSRYRLFEGSYRLNLLGQAWARVGSSWTGWLRRWRYYILSKRPALFTVWHHATLENRQQNLIFHKSNFIRAQL